MDTGGRCSHHQRARRRTDVTQPTWCVTCRISSRRTHSQPHQSVRHFDLRFSSDLLWPLKIQPIKFPFNFETHISTKVLKTLRENCLPWIHQVALQSSCALRTCEHTFKLHGVFTGAPRRQNFDFVRVDVRNGLNCLFDILHWVLYQKLILTSTF